MPQNNTVTVNVTKLKKASTLVKFLIANGILALLLAGIIVAMNPVKKIAEINNNKRSDDIIKILNAIHQYAADNNGNYPSKMLHPGSSGFIASNDIDLCAVLVPKYLTTLPADPKASNGGINITNCNEEYNTGYTITVRASDNQITISAPNAELTTTISYTR